MNRIYFIQHYVRIKQLQRRALKKFLLALFYKEHTLIDSVTIIFCLDPFLLTLNKSFLQHEYLTDTMTFVLSSPNQPIIGEVYISINRVKENAKDLNIEFSLELVRIIIHGCLHLCGYDDKHRADKNEMLEVQEKYMKEWIVSRETSIG